MPTHSFATLLYRYFFFGWLFRRPSPDETGVFDRAAILRHNRKQAAWLPVYILRWLWLALILYGIAGAQELLLEAPFMARFFYLGSAMCLSFTVSIATSWLSLRLRGPDRTGS